MLQGLLQQLEESGSSPPRYTGARCLLERGAMQECTLCRDICPHEALALRQAHTPQLGIALDAERCTHCGLCVQVCPTAALEYPLSPLLQALHEQAQTQPPAQPEQATQAGKSCSVCCSQSALPPESGVPQVTCLGRISVGTVAAVGVWAKELTLLHGPCEQCQVGSAEVPTRLEQVAAQAATLRAATGKMLKVHLRPPTPKDQQGQQVSRRQGLQQLLALGRRYVASSVSTALPQPPLLTAPASADSKSRAANDHIPEEWAWRGWAALRPRPAVDAAISWPAPLIDASCIDCPVCVNICPSQAIVREGQALLLQLEACSGCQACIEACPPHAMHLQKHWLNVAFAAPIVLRDASSAAERAPSEGTSEGNDPA